VFFNGGNPPNSMLDGTYVCVATATDAGGLSQSRTFNLIISFVDPPTNTFPGYTVVCARDTTYTQNNLPNSFVKLALGANDPANTCNV